MTARVPPSPATHVPWRSRTVQVVLASTFIAPLGVPLVAPALPALRDAFGVTDAGASLLITAYFVGGGVASPLVGLVADRAGRKRVLVAGLVAFAATGAASALAPTFGWLLALRALQGTAAAGLFIATITLVGDLYAGPQRNAILGANVAVLSVGRAVFPIVGGALVAIAWNAPFLAYLIAAPVGLFAALVLEEPAADRGRTGGDDAREWRLAGAVAALAGRGAFGLYAAALATELLTFGAVFTAIPFLLAGAFGSSPVAIGAVLAAAAAASVATSSSNGRFGRHLSNPGLVAAGFACHGVGLAVAWLAGSPLAVGVGAAAFGAGLGLSMPAVDAAVADLVPGRYRAEAVGLRNGTTFLGRAAGPVVFAGAAVATGYRTLLLGAAAVALGFSVLAVVAAGGRLRAQAPVDP